MALRYKEIEAAAADKRQKMLPDGTPNFYAFVRASGSVFWTVRLMVEDKRTNLSIGGVRTIRTNLKFSLHSAPSLQAAAATQRERRSGSA